MQFLNSFSLQALLFGFSLQDSLPVPRTVKQFDNPTWLENIAATRDGHLLTGIIGKPELHLVNAFAAPNATDETLLYSFPGADSVFGITELEPDVWAVATGTYSTKTGPTNGSFSIWKVNLHNSANKFDKVADLPDSQLYNGMAALNAHTVLIADSFAGTIVKLDVNTKKHEVAINHPLLAPDFNQTLAIGVNGIKVNHATNPPTVYFSNLQLAIVGSVPVNPTTGHAVGDFTTVGTNITVADDLTVTEDGTVYVAKVYADEIVRVVKGQPNVVVANTDVIKGPSAATLGRTARDRGVVYVSTNGGVIQTGDGGFVEGGKIAAISLY